MSNIPEIIIDDKIFQLRGIQIMIDKDLAELYQVETKVLNQTVKRNLNRFPTIFRFQINDSEKNELVTICDRFQNLKHSSVNPYAFTEQGVAMLSAILRSEVAINISIQIMQAFVKMKSIVISNEIIQQRLNKLEQKQFNTDQKFNQIFHAFEDKNVPAKQGIFFNGQIFDAYTLIADIIRSADKSIIIIDNYLDDTVLKQLSKRNNAVSVKLYTKNINQVLKQDVEKHNLQYPEIVLKKLTTYHDRFIIIDNKIVYHIGASLKDAGKKCFAFSKLDIDVNVILAKL